jgi:hypothetical protein
MDRFGVFTFRSFLLIMEILLECGLEEAMRPGEKELKIS